MANNKTVGFGLLGAGLIAPFHAKSILAAQGCELIAVADMNADRVKKVADEYGCKAYSSLDELLGDESINVVNILLPNHLHSGATITSAKAGKHVITEKPPAMSLAETDAMLAACKEAGVKLGITLQCRVRKSIEAMRKAIAEGRFGKVLQADAYMKWYRSTEYYLSDVWRSSRKSGAGVTIQHAFHYIDLLQYLMGDVTSVQARMSNMAHPEVELEDTLLAFVNYANGAQGVVSASTAFYPGSDVRIEINGEKGTAVMVGERIDTWKFEDERAEDEKIRMLGCDSVGTAASGPADFDFANHQVVIESMRDAVLGKGEPFISVESARDTLEIALAMYKSARKGGEVVQLPFADEESAWD